MSRRAKYPQPKMGDTNSGTVKDDVECEICASMDFLNKKKKKVILIFYGRHNQSSALTNNGIQGRI